MIKVGRVYTDSTGCTIKIVHKLKGVNDFPFIGVVLWHTAKDEYSKDCPPDLDFYSYTGKCKFLNQNNKYNLRKRKDKKSKH